MTETGAAACIMAHREPRHVGTSCFGRAEPFVETRIVTDKGADAGVDVPGELLVRAAGAEPRRDFFLGYLKDDDATEEAWAGGWFHTGDVVRAQRRRRLLLRRPAQERDPAQRREHLGGRGRERAQPASGGGRRAPVAATPDPVRGDEVLACIVLRKAPNRARPSGSRPASSAMRSSGSPTSRRRATSPSSMPCR